MKKLLILSDIHGLFLSERIDRLDLADRSKVDRAVEQDSVVLAGLAEERDVNRRHEKMIGGGIDVAAAALLEQHPTGFDVALGLSVGGTILWRAALKGLPIRKLICLSSTRLRFETKAPDCDIRLFFGESDVYQPPQEWFEHLGLSAHRIPGHGHEFYRADIGLKIFYQENS